MARDYKKEYVNLMNVLADSIIDLSDEEILEEFEEREREIMINEAENKFLDSLNRFKRNN